MIDHLVSPKYNESVPAREYLEPGESIVIVDDSKEILLIFENVLVKKGFKVFTAETATEAYQIMERERIALVLLDINLPDMDGTDILADIVLKYPDMSVIMLTGTTDLNVAMSCLREGADDYLAKPVNLHEFSLAVRRVLQKRRLIIDNRNYQEQLELTNYRTRFLHQLNLKMNNAYLGSIELDSVLRTILTGITAEEGLKFNRAFLMLFDENHETLKGAMAIGPPRREDAERVWNEIKEKNLHLTDILQNVQSSTHNIDSGLSEIIRNVTIEADNHDHVLIKACDTRNSIHVTGGMAEGQPVPHELMECLQENNFVITPLFSPKQSLGVIIADNFITGRPINIDDISSLEIFASQASLAIEHSHLYQDMLDKITELERVTAELENNKDLLVDAERYSVVGHMAAQLAHSIRNPITTIGGMARLMARKSTDEKDIKFLKMMIDESKRIESTLDDLFTFVGDEQNPKSMQLLYPLIQNNLRLFYGVMKKQYISYKLDLPSPEPQLYMDGKRIQQMLLHLIRNGLEAMPSGGILTIRCIPGDTDLVITIEDSGSGIENEDIKRASDPFYTTKTYGTGMGLSLVEKIVKEHNGSFSLSRGEEGGMIARVVLPINGQDENQAPESQAGDISSPS